MSSASALQRSIFIAMPCSIGWYDNMIWRCVNCVIPAKIRLFMDYFAALRSPDDRLHFFNKIPRRKFNGGQLANENAPYLLICAGESMVSHRRQQPE
jgi:hypothetical protein